MSEEYPLFPELTEEGANQAREVMQKIVKGIAKMIQEETSDLYHDLPCYIESDSWTNFRNNMIAAFCNYSNRLKQGEHDFAKLRKKIYEEYREELIPDLNQDLVKEIEELKKQIHYMEEARRPW